MSQKGRRDPQDEGPGVRQDNTTQTSQDEQVRGYLKSLTDTVFVEELREALAHARRLTGKQWRVIVTTDEVILRSQSLDQISLPSPRNQ
ncbi:MAG: hypothetical protein ACOCV2_11805 [Persicimonas sp.]